MATRFLHMGKKAPASPILGSTPLFRVLGRYARAKPSVLSMETAVHKMTGFPAQRLNSEDRGRIEEGLVADRVIFDPETVIDRATFEDPPQ